jgi:hypothetical protein
MLRGRASLLLMTAGLAAGAAACSGTESRVTPEAGPSPARPAVGAAVTVRARPADAAATEAEPPAAAPQVTGEPVLPAEPLVADRRFVLGLRLRNEGDVAVRLQPRPAGRVPTGRLRLSRGDEPLGELALSHAGWVASFGDRPLELAPGAEATFELVQTRAPTAFGNVELRIEYQLLDEAGAAVPAVLAPAEVAVTWAGVTVLHIGDSLVAGGLTSRLAQRVREAGGRYVADGWVSSNAPKWLGAERLPQLLRDNLPEIVLVTLGTNEYEVGDLDEYLSWYDRLAERLGRGRRCFWIGPPRLPGADRFVEAAARHTAPCPYLDSRDVEPNAGRGRDHLTKSRGEEWADRIWTWLGTQWRP